MKIKITRLLLMLLLFILVVPFAKAQNNILLIENFETGGASFSTNCSPPAAPSTNTGTNQWTVNKVYLGMPLYPNSWPQDSLYSLGSHITSPNNNYLHIQDKNSTALNANYKPSNVSDQFACMTKESCTIGFSNVVFTFMYLCEGNATDYGEAYYSKNGGPWTLCGPGSVGSTKYNNTSKWRYQTIHSAAFDNSISLRFGFRWVNNSGAAPTQPFSIDDVIIAADFNPNAAGSAKIWINSVHDTVCIGKPIPVNWGITDTLCDGNYIYELLDGGVPISTWNGPMYFPQLAASVTLPTSGVAVGLNTCYKLRITRTNPPLISSTGTFCIVFKDCGNTVTSAPSGGGGPGGNGSGSGGIGTFKDPDTTCAGSVFDAKFWSVGLFKPGNIYKLELSNANGVFTNPPNYIGSNPSTHAFDQALDPNNPGSISGKIPDSTPFGCGYKTRVVSTNPVTVGSELGPFCIKHCDIITNNGNNISICIDSCVYMPGWDTLMPYDIGMFGNKYTYGSNNKFKVQIIDHKEPIKPVAFNILWTGLPWGEKKSTTGGTIGLHVPCLDSLLNMGAEPPPGWSYYMRVIADDVSPAGTKNGTLVRLTIGAPAHNGVKLAPDEPAYCVGAVATIGITNYNKKSTYTWRSSFFKAKNGKLDPNGTVGNPFVLDKPNDQSISFQCISAAKIDFTCTEDNFNCVGITNPKVYVNIRALPIVGIVGTSPACQGDTVTFSTKFEDNTFYNWTLSAGGNLIDISNNIVKARFDAVGSYTFTCLAVNECGSVTRTKAIKVLPKPVYKIRRDTLVCSGSTVKLDAGPANPAYLYAWKQGKNSLGTSSFITVSPTVTTVYSVIISGGPGLCVKTDTTRVRIALSDLKTQKDTGICLGESLTLTARGADTYSWSPSDGLSITTGSFVTVTPSVTTTYSLTGAGDGCLKTVSFKIYVGGGTHADAGPDLLVSIGGSSTLLGSGGAGAYSWSPADGLSSTTVRRPIVTPVQDTKYTLTVKDSLGCVTETDTVWVRLELPCGKLYVPNVFSPDGDGKNDVLSVINNCVVQINYRIYDRLGEKVFETTDPSKGWDGTYKGKPLNTAVFVYYVDAILRDGKQLSEKGNVTLLRNSK